jgi:hypothetical protein
MVTRGFSLPRRVTGGGVRWYRDPRGHNHGHIFMLMVIFGAGASFDSYVSRPPNPKHPEEYRPPLTSELFDDRPAFNRAFQQFDKGQPLIAKLRYLTESETLEQVLERVDSESQGYAEGRKQLAAIRYYIQWVISDCEVKWGNVHMGATNHKALFNRIEFWRVPRNEPVCIVTFNYDSLIEEALSMFDLLFKDMSHYTQHSSYKVIKLHGSVNWVHPMLLPIVSIEQLTPLEISQHLIRGIDAANVSLNGFEIQNEIPPPRIRHCAYLPAIAIPVQAKSSFECPQDHVNVLNEAIPQVDKLIVVGWRGQEQHFTGLFQKLQRRVSVLIVAGNEKDTEQTKTALKEAGVRGVYTEYSRGFSNFIRDEPLIDKFLSTQAR